MSTYTKAQLATELNNSIGYITFTKRDGSIRHMVCTRNQKLYPVYIPKTKSTNEYDHLLLVQDLEKNAFRSFVIDNVIEVRFEKRAKGIYFDRRRNRYVVRKQVNGQRKYIGSAKTYVEAIELLKQKD